MFVEIMRKSAYTSIIQFEIIQVARDGEKVGDKITLDEIGDYSHIELYRSYKLTYLLDNDLFYRVCVVMMNGKPIKLYTNRPKNYAKNLHHLK